MTGKTRKHGADVRTERDNAITHGLTSSRPPAMVAFPWYADHAAMGQVVTALGDSVAWMAEALRREIREETSGKAQNYTMHMHQMATFLTKATAQAAELHRFGAELLGQGNIPPARLGKLTYKQWEALMRRLARDARLALRQCKAGYVWMQAHGVLDDEGKMRQVLEQYLQRARYTMRTMQVLASCRAWYTNRNQDDMDPAALAMRVIAADASDAAPTED